MSESTPDEKAILAAVEKAGRIRTDQAKLKVKELLLIRKTLTPEQIEKIKELIRQRMNKNREEGNGKRGKDRPERGDRNRPGRNPGNPVPPPQAPGPVPEDE